MRAFVSDLGRFVATALGLAAAAAAQDTAFDCAFEPVEAWVPRWEAALARGAVQRPERPALLPAGRTSANSGSSSVFSTDHVFPFEDADGLLLTDFSDFEAVELMRDGANAVLANFGDEFDFVGFFTNFQPHHTIGTAFYRGIRNDVLGIRDPNGQPGELFDYHRLLGLDGERIQGLLMLWDINGTNWKPGDGPGTQGTRLALNHEFGHRFVCFLPPLAGGRALQGLGAGGCGTPSHWNRSVDGGGSAMQLPDWVGSNPAQLTPGLLRFNTDSRRLYSPTDLYLMGFFSPAEMDATNTQLRYMDGYDCTGTTHTGGTTSFSSQDVIAVAGDRVPDWMSSPKHFRTAWVMIHLPGDPPATEELEKVVGILVQQSQDYSLATYGRGSMRHVLYEDGDDVQPYGCGVNPDASLVHLGGRPSVTVPLVLGVDNPLGTQSPGSLPFVALSLAPANGYPCGPRIPGMGMSAVGAPGELLIDPSPANLQKPYYLNSAWLGPGQPQPIAIRIPPLPELIGTVLYAQGVLIDRFLPPGTGFQLTGAMRLTIGP